MSDKQRDYKICSLELVSFYFSCTKHQSRDNYTPIDKEVTLVHANRSLIWKTSSFHRPQIITIIPYI